MKRIVSLWFPKLSTDRLARATPDWSARSAATVVWLEGCPRLIAVNPHARTAGLRPHMRLADARALLPDLVTTPGEPQADQRLIETIANWCDRYTPWVAIDPLGGALAEEGIEACSVGGFGGDAGLLLDVTGCAHLFGQGEVGERALLVDLTAGRRLSLAAEKNGVPALLLRGQPAPPQSVCTTRWRVASAGTHSTPGLNDVGAPRWRIELRRNRFGVPSVTETPNWLLEWNDETHCLSVVPQALHGSTRESDARLVG
jgi:hypothetical protein